MRPRSVNTRTLVLNHCRLERRVIGKLRLKSMRVNRLLDQGRGGHQCLLFPTASFVGRRFFERRGGPGVDQLDLSVNEVTGYLRRFSANLTRVPGQTKVTKGQLRASPVGYFRASLGRTVR